MTDISVLTTVSQVENRSWLKSPHGTEPGTTPSVTLDAALFTGLYPNGYVPSGCGIAKVTATGYWGPADSTATDGRQTWTDETVGILFGSLPIKSATSKVGGARVVHGFVDPAKLPFQSGAGTVTAAVRAALRLIHFSA